MNFASSSTGFVTPCKARSPAIVAPVPLGVTLVETKVAVGNLAESKKSGWARCVFSAALVVTRPLSGIVIRTCAAAGFAGSSTSVPVAPPKMPQ